jgi:2-keto-4-pentenoate hydratase/2-oxohepta-3-ene-1,7-dioic acid hydratase in catechol pathway
MGEDIVAYLRGTQPGRDAAPRPLGDVALGAPVPNPSKIICVGLNYYDHASEAGFAAPDEPVLFAKYPNSLIGPDVDIVVPDICSAVDYEAELGLVIGRTAARVSTAHALDYVAGYMCLNDVSDRVLQMHGSQWTRGKTVDTFLPAGPWLTTADEIDDPQALDIRCLVNGEVRQAASTRQMIFGLAELVSFISRTITLQPGDLIATGTPEGVGMASNPPRYLNSGDEVVVEIEKLGSIRNRVRPERAGEMVPDQAKGDGVRVYD